MLQKLLCWVLGHKTMFKAATGNILVADGAFDRDVKHALMKWERSKYCLRCGIKVHELPEFREYARQKYPTKLDEELITMIEDLIQREMEG